MMLRYIDKIYGRIIISFVKLEMFLIIYKNSRHTTTTQRFRISIICIAI